MKYLLCSPLLCLSCSCCSFLSSSTSFLVFPFHKYTSLCHCQAARLCQKLQTISSDLQNFKGIEKVFCFHFPRLFHAFVTKLPCSIAASFSCVKHWRCSSGLNQAHDLIAKKSNEVENKLLARFETASAQEDIATMKVVILCCASCVYAAHLPLLLSDLRCVHRILHIDVQW